MKTEEILKKFFPEPLLENLGSIEFCVISFSGGIDSSVLLALMARLIPPHNIHSITFSSWFHFENELRRARDFCCNLGARCILLPGPELKIPEVRNNDPERCYHCKSVRMEELSAYARSRNIGVILEGSNRDDLNDRSRLGTRALAEYSNVRSPLAEAGLNKEQVRELGRLMGIPWWNDDATACLATRFPPFTALEEKTLQDVAAMERSLRELGLPCVRIRVDGRLARIEVPVEYMEAVLTKRKNILEILGNGDFSKITLDLEGYGSFRKIRNLETGGAE